MYPLCVMKVTKTCGQVIKVSLFLYDNRSFDCVNSARNTIILEPHCGV